MITTAKPTKKRVAVLMGGFSVEREVSLSTGQRVIDALRELGHEIIPIDVTRDVNKLISALTPKPDVAINVLHGRWGEDGCVQGLLELLEVPYTHSGVLGSALAMNKVVTRQICEAVGVRCPEGRIATLSEVRNGSVMQHPFVIKPINEGSSIGVHIIRTPSDEIPDEASWPYGEQVLVERYIPGRELHIAVIGGKAVGVLETQSHTTFLDYEAKYTPGKSTHVMPAPIHPEAYELALRWSEVVHNSLACRGVSRTDFRYDDTQGEPGKLYFLEINSQPGMTPTSILPDITTHLGISFPQLIQWMLEDASCQR